MGRPRKGVIPHRGSPFLLVSFYLYFSLFQTVACLARERDGRTERAGKKKKKSLPCFQARLCIRMPLNASLLPYNFLLRAFRKKMGGVPPAPPIF